jgi:putative hydrolase of the HAD superfamily
MSWTTSPPPAVVLFDLDDTIIDFGSSAGTSWRTVCDEAAAAGAIADAEALRDAIERTSAWFWSDAERHRVGRADLVAATTRIVGQALEETGDDAGQAAALAVRYRELRHAATRLLDGAVHTLEWLAARGTRLALVTNGTSGDQRGKIARFALDHHFEHVAIEGEAGVGKPDPRAYELALARLACEADGCWMVGDNLEWDVAAPQSLGLRAVWVDAAGAGVPAGVATRPDHVVRSIRELVP